MPAAHGYFGCTQTVYVTAAGLTIKPEGFVGTRLSPLQPLKGVASSAASNS